MLVERAVRAVMVVLLEHRRMDLRAVTATVGMVATAVLLVRLVMVVAVLLVMRGRLMVVRAALVVIRVLQAVLVLRAVEQGCQARMVLPVRRL